MSVKTAGEVTLADVGRFITFRRPADATSLNPSISGRLTAVQRTKRSGREIVTLSVGSIGGVEMSPRHEVDVRHVWRDREPRPDRYNIPMEDAPTLRAKLHGGPLNEELRLIGTPWSPWDRRGLTVQLSDHSYVYYLHTHIPDGVERKATSIQEKHGIYGLVLHGTVHMRYRPRESAELNRQDTPPS